MTSDFETDKTGKILTGYHGNSTCINVPEGIVIVASDAFKNSNITSVLFPASLKLIGFHAFENSISLQSVVLPNLSARIMDGAFSGCSKLADENGFVIINNHLIEYFGDNVDVRIPDGVTDIQSTAFEDKGISSIYIPGSVKTIGSRAFANNGEIQIKTDYDFDFSKVFVSSDCLLGCTVHKDESGLIIRNNAVVKYLGINPKVEIPEGVSAIKDHAFYENHLITEIIIPESVKIIGDYAFSGCNNLKTVIIQGKNVKLGKNLVNWCSGIEKFELYGCDMPVDIHDGVSLAENNFLYLPSKLVPFVSDFLDMLSDADIKTCILADKKIWQSLSLEQQADTYVKLMNDKFQFKSFLKKCIGSGDIVPLGQKIFEKISEDPGRSHLEGLMWYLETYYKKLSDDYVKDAYELIIKHDTDGSLKKRFNENRALKEKFYSEEELKGQTNIVENMVLDRMKSEKIDLEKLGKKLYSKFLLRPSDLPELYDSKGNKLDYYVLEWLLCTDRSASSVIKLLDHECFHKALNDLADKYICNGFAGIKQCYLAYPLCRYADEDLMKKMCAAAPKLATHSSGRNSRAMIVFREAVRESDTRSAIMFADKYNELDKYAEARNKSVDELRDMISDTGLNVDDRKEYDLGNQKVVAFLKNDLSFIIELPNGKTAKSLPKKGADPLKYADAAADFAKLKKAVKDIYKYRSDALFKDFLSGSERTPESWAKTYLDNPVLNHLARLIVWKQSEATFTVTDHGAVTSDEKSYEIAEEPVAVAYPTEMKPVDLNAWKTYFTSHQLKQPFLQIWEPVCDPSVIKADRYSDLSIPYYRFANQEKNGIHAEKQSGNIEITFDDCNVRITRLDWNYSIKDKFNIDSFKFSKFTRKVNHLIAYFDKIAVYDLIHKDDASFKPILNEFTLPQINEFIKYAGENKCVNASAVLLEYKNQKYGTSDPLDEFELNW